MNQGPDFAIFSSDRQLQLVVEVKGTPTSDERWAAKFRRNLLAHGAVPCVGEPYERLIRRDRQRREVHRKLKEELRELARSAPYAHAASNLDGLTGLLVEAGDDELDSLNDTLTRLLNTAKLIPIDRVVLQGALTAQTALGLSPQDSIVYASVRSSVIAATEAPCLLNKNSKDFLIPQIEEEFSAHNCKLLARFSDGLSYVNNDLATLPGKH